MGGVVRDPNRVVFVLVRNNGEHRPEDLLSRHGHAVLNIRNGTWNHASDRSCKATTAITAYFRCLWLDQRMQQSLRQAKFLATLPRLLRQRSKEPLCRVQDYAGRSAEPDAKCPLPNGFYPVLRCPPGIVLVRQRPLRKAKSSSSAL